MPGQSHLAALSLRLDLLERVAAVEVVVELDEAAVAELPWVQVVVRDVVADEAPVQRGVGLVAAGRQPLAVGAQRLAGVDRGQRRRDPARLERVGAVGARAARLDAELAPGLEDRVADLVVGLVRAPDLEPGSAGHAVAERADALAGDVHLGHPEELELLDRAAVDLLDHLPRVRALDLEAPLLAMHRLAVRARRASGRRSGTRRL